MAGSVPLRGHRLVGAVVLLSLAAGCYTLQPARGYVPEAGTRIALDLNDEGRVAMRNMVGPEIAQIEGRLLEKTDEGYLVAVSHIRHLRGEVQVWSGEEVRIDSDYVGMTYERRFSASRSLVAGAATVGGIVAIALGADLIGGGTTPGDGNPGDTIRTVRLPRR